MSKYLKLFETTSDYEAYINGGGVVLPNVSVAKDAPKTVYFNPWVEPFFVKLSLNNGEVVELQDSGELKQTMVTPYKTTVISAEIGELCTSIGSGAFSSCSALTSVTIGNGVTSIGYVAFSGCTGLTSITIPDNVTTIGNSAFYGCSGLTSITIGSGVTSIGTSAFESCRGLTTVTIGSGLRSIGDDAFRSCSGLTNITIPSSVTRIGGGAFYQCASLTSITSLATKAPTIGNTTFYSVKTNGTLTVPINSTGYDVWMGTDYSYLGYRGWTKVEQ